MQNGSSLPRFAGLRADFSRVSFSPPACRWKFFPKVTMLACGMTAQAVNIVQLHATVYDDRPGKAPNQALLCVVGRIARIVRIVVISQARA